MRSKKMTFLSCAIVAAIGLLASPSAMATGSLLVPSFAPTVTILAGPCPVTARQPHRLRAGRGVHRLHRDQVQGHGQPGPRRHLVTANNTVLVPSGFQVYPACDGDPVTGLGKYSCHEEAVKVNPTRPPLGSSGWSSRGRRPASCSAWS